MSHLKVKTNPKIEEVFTKYPDLARGKLQYLRELVRETAEAIDSVEELEETLKWGEPSFLTQYGSTLRMDWKEKTPNQYAMYFKCTSRLVDTFKMVFGDRFQFEGTRAIVFQMDQEIPVLELKECIKAALIYHKVKHLITLGI